MPTQVGIHDSRLLHAAKAWMPTCVGMTVGAWAEESAISAPGFRAAGAGCGLRQLPALAFNSQLLEAD
jgi:hypothetical protein